MTDSTDIDGHQLTLRMRVDADGGVWGGVGVCPACEPDDQVRRTFTHGRPCPRCGGEGELEWRRIPDLDHLVERLAGDR